MRIVLIVLLAGCGSAQPPAGPAHQMSGTKEAPTACPREREEAQEAREMLLGSADPRRLQEAGQRVLAEAMCESSALRAIAVPSGSHDRILSGLRALRSQMQDASNLYQEVLRYELPSLHGLAYLGQSETTRIYADKVADIVPPSDLDGPGKLEFEAELEQSLAILRAESEALQARGCAALAQEGASDPRCE